MDKIETKYLNALAKYLLSFSTETQPAYTTEFAPLKKASKYTQEQCPDKKKLMFLDLGCGIGNVLFTAKEILGKEHKYVGVDMNNYYAGIAQNIDLDFGILNIDILSDQTIALLKTADIVYAYRPMREFQKMHKMYFNINAYLKEGAYFLCNDEDIVPPFQHMKELKTFTGLECCDQSIIRVYKKLAQKLQ